MAERLLVLGGTGMLGHALVGAAAARGTDVWWTSRAMQRPGVPGAPAGAHVGGVDVTDMPTVHAAIDRARPDVIVNCAGTVKQRTEVSPAEMIRVNAVFPHELAAAARAAGARVVHISSDCVFEGVPGDRPTGYTEHDRPDATDVYGRSKALGEPDPAGAVTVRTSMIGRELGARRLGLLEWFLAAGDEVRGFTEAWFSGLTTAELSAVLLDRVIPATELQGLYHVAGPAISKHDLLVLLRDRFRPGVRVQPDDRVRVDRRLDGDRFAAATGYAPPSWAAMLDALHAGPVGSRA